MDCRSVRFDAEKMVSIIGQVPESAWSTPSAFRDTDVHHGYRRVPLVTAKYHYPVASLFDVVWDAFGPVRDATLSQLLPGGFIVPHRDAGPWLERWQIPIVVSGQWHSVDPPSVVAGFPFMVKHWESHAVTNRGSVPRIHLVVDRDIPVCIESLPFATFPVPADMADLVDRSRQ